MKILHLNANIDKKNLSFPHYQFHKLMLNKGHRSKLIVSYGDFYENEISIFKKKNRFFKLDLSLILRKVFFGYLINTADIHYFPEWNTRLTSINKIKNQLDFKPDIIITYWTKYSFNQKIIYKLSKFYEAPIVSVLYDMAHLTGGCHYSFGCENYKDRCGYCPALNSNTEIDLSRITWNFKKKYIDRTHISLLAGSEDSLNEASQSGLYKNKKIYKMLGSVDENIFKPGEKYIIRNKLGIDNYKKIIFFGAANIKEPRKGFNYLVEALDILKEKYLNQTCSVDDICLLIAGRKIDNLNLPFNHKFLGYLDTQDKLADAFRCADVFACPSVEDSGPMMVNISIMSGTPVVTFDIGVSKDLVFNNETGYRAETRNVEDFAKGLNSILSLDNIEWNCFSKNCRDLGIELCSTETQYNRLLFILEDVIDNYHKDGVCHDIL